MKLIIQIPCYNEETTLPITLAALPRHVPGFDEVEWLVIDDGSRDRTAEVARAHGVDHIVRHKVNKGLAAAFQTGLNACLERGADVIVNTDADNQYPGAAIPDLVHPILEGRADMVIGARRIDEIPHFSPVKKLLQRVGSAVVRAASETDVPDAPSGFRALSREVALRINIFTRYTYTLETIIQAGAHNFSITHIPVTVNPKLRDSRLIRSTPRYVLRSAASILQLYTIYKPLRLFLWIALPFLLFGSALWLRYLIIMLQGEAERGAHLQSIVIGAVAILLSFIIGMFGLLGELISINRRLHEDTLYLVRKRALRKNTSSQISRKD
jgi:glycosyltransferase involved in cell wall biosynthesis